MNIVQNTKPAILPLLFSTMKTALRIDGDDEDILINGKIKAAQKLIENYTNRVLLSCTFTAYLDSIPDGTIVEIYKYPVTAVSSVKYYNSAGVLTTLVANTDYVVDIKDCPIRIKFLTLPTIQADIFNGIEIAFTAGHSAISDIDDDVLEALQLIVGDFYENRQNQSTMNLNDIAINYRTILDLCMKGSYFQ